MRRFKTLALGLTSALALAAAVGSASAADLGGGYKDGPADDYGPPLMWSGFYFGINIGAAFEDADDIDILDDAALIGGGHFGYNWQLARYLVLGVEADITDLENVDTLVSMRGRLGLALGPTLLYGTAGVAFFGEADTFDEETDTALVFGGGIERKLSDSVSFGVEGLYYDFENDTGDELSFWAARARLTYHVGGW